VLHDQWLLLYVLLLMKQHSHQLSHKFLSCSVILKYCTDNQKSPWSIHKAKLPNYLLFYALGWKNRITSKSYNSMKNFLNRLKMVSYNHYYSKYHMACNYHLDFKFWLINWIKSNLLNFINWKWYIKSLEKTIYKRLTALMSYGRQISNLYLNVYMYTKDQLSKLNYSIVKNHLLNIIHAILNH